MKREQNKQPIKSVERDYPPVYYFIVNNIKKALKFRQHYLLLILIIVAIGASATSVYFYNRYRQTNQSPQEEIKAETDKLLAQVSKIVLLPGGETPTIATISDPDKLKNQPFFSDAQEGDKVLIYTNAKKAFIYRPGIGKIISVAPLMINGSSEFNVPAPK